MNILDENIPAIQRQRLENWRIPIQQIGFDVGRRGMQDEEIITLLQQLRRITFFTRDEDFYDRQLCHIRYSLVYLAVERDEVAAFARRVLKHPKFDTQAKRMEAVIRVSSTGLSVWRLNHPWSMRSRIMTRALRMFPRPSRGAMDEPTSFKKPPC